MKLESKLKNHFLYKKDNIVKMKRISAAISTENFLPLFLLPLQSYGKNQKLISKSFYSSLLSSTQGSTYGKKTIASEFIVLISICNYSNWLSSHHVKIFSVFDKQQLE